MYRSRGIATPGKSVYGPRERDRWLRQLPVSSRWATEKLHEEYDLLLGLKREAEQELVAVGRKIIHLTCISASIHSPHSKMLSLKIGRPASEMMKP